MWAKVDDQWWQHDKVLPLPLAARGLWITALSRSGAIRSDRVTAAFVRMVAGDDGDDLAQQLVDAGLWHKDGDDTWAIHDWDDYQVTAQAEQKAEAGRVGGLTRALRAAEERAEQAENALSQAQSKQNPSTPQAPPKQGGKQTGQADPKHGPEPVPEPVPVSRTGPVVPDKPAPPSDCVHKLDQQGQHRTDTPCDTCTNFLEHFWPVYPDRGGRKRGKGRALAAWRSLTLEQQRQAVRGARNLAAEDTLPKDPFRFLRRDTAGQFPFMDHQEPPRATGGRAPPAECETCSQPLTSHNDDWCIPQEVTDDD